MFNSKLLVYQRVTLPFCLLWIAKSPIQAGKAGEIMTAIQSAGLEISAAPGEPGDIPATSDEGSLFFHGKIDGTHGLLWFIDVFFLEDFSKST